MPLAAAVVLGVIGAAVVALVLASMLQLRRANVAATVFEFQFWSGRELAEIATSEAALAPHPLGLVFLAGVDEHHAGGGAEAVAGQMAAARSRQMELMGRNLDLLAGAIPAALLPGLLVLLAGLLGVPGGIATSLPVLASGGLVALLSTVARLLLGAGVRRFSGRMLAFAMEFSAILGRAEQDAARPMRLNRSAA